MLIERVIRDETDNYMKKYMSDPENVTDTHFGFTWRFDRYHNGYIEDIMTEMYIRYEALVVALCPTIFDFDESGEPTFIDENDMWTMQDRFNYYFEHWYTRKHPEIYPMEFPRGRVEKLAIKVGYRIVHEDKTEQLTMF